MSENQLTADEVLSMEEFDELLAEATGATAEELRRGAKEIYIAPSEESTVIDE
ncbi:hypothetical protein [Salinigranum halophilum]|jgi:hypothetical protein|uniref:hypothetical protein n=1 Tax=Salinigranum halophilum TaxID=2565931 RepID=UPI0013764A2B|nr:hypothetical protein [Salinigranum halophilum]